MADLIYRQQAVDAFETAAKSGACIEDIKLILAEMPSAQPEIIRCKDCKYYCEYGYVNGKPKFLPRCTFSAIYVDADDFCSKAERREDETD